MFRSTCPHWASNFSQKVSNCFSKTGVLSWKYFLIAWKIIDLWIIYHRKRQISPGRRKSQILIFVSETSSIGCLFVWDSAKQVKALFIQLSHLLKHVGGDVNASCMFIQAHGAGDCMPSNDARSCAGRVLRYCPDKREVSNKQAMFARVAANRVRPSSDHTRERPIKISKSARRAGCGVVTWQGAVMLRVAQAAL